MAAVLYAGSLLYAGGMLDAGSVWAQAVPEGQTGQAVPQAAPSVSGGYTVTGRVLCADTQRPARFAQVNLLPAEGDSDGGGRGGRRLSARTDLDGNFSVSGVPVGDYYVAGQLSGYVNVTQAVQNALSGGSDPGTALAGVPLVHVGAGGGSAEIALARGGVLAGTVVWDDGSPAGGVQVAAQAAPTTGVQGGSATQADTSGFGRNGAGFGGGPGGGFGGGQTDDRGHFRLSGLLPGAYLVRANLQAPVPVRGGNARGYTPNLNVAFYAPNKPRRTDAAVVTLAGSEERDDINITLAVAGLHSISGTVSSTGATVRSGALNLTDQSDSTLNRIGVINADGSFVIPYVPPGNYTLRATASAQAAATGGRGGGSAGSGGGGPQFQPLQVSVTVPESDVTGLGLTVTVANQSQ